MKEFNSDLIVIISIPADFSLYTISLWHTINPIELINTNTITLLKHHLDASHISESTVLCVCVWPTWIYYHICWVIIAQSILSTLSIWTRSDIVIMLVVLTLGSFYQHSSLFCLYLFAVEIYILNTNLHSCWYSCHLQPF